MTNLMVAFVLLFDTFYHYMNFKWLVLLFSLRYTKDMGGFGIRESKLRHIA